MRRSIQSRKMELTLGSETSTHFNQTPGLYPKENTLNHRTVYSDQSQTTHQHSGPNKRRRLGSVKPVKNFGLWNHHTSFYNSFPLYTCTNRRRTIHIVNCWSAVVIIHKQPCSIPQVKLVPGLKKNYIHMYKIQNLYYIATAGSLTLCFIHDHQRKA
jgi:hypothetical protein